MSLRKLVNLFTKCCWETTTLISAPPFCLWTKECLCWDQHLQVSSEHTKSVEENQQELYNSTLYLHFQWNWTDEAHCKKKHKALLLLTSRWRQNIRKTTACLSGWVFLDYCWLTMSQRENTDVYQLSCEFISISNSYKCILH